jgi:hypothetical protein
MDMKAGRHDEGKEERAGRLDRLAKLQRGNHSFRVITLLTNGPLLMGCQCQAHNAANSTAQCKSHLSYHYFSPFLLGTVRSVVLTHTVDCTSF